MLSTTTSSEAEGLIPNEAVALLNIGTSCQFSAVLPSHTDGPEESSWRKYASKAGSEVRPYFYGRQLLVAAALSGGNTLATFAQSLKGWVDAIIAKSGGGTTSVDSVYSVLNEASEELEASSVMSDLDFDPRFFGERVDTAARASIRNISAENFTLGHMWQSLQQGLVSNVLTLVGGKEVLQALKVQRIICVGGYDKYLKHVLATFVSLDESVLLLLKL